MLHNVLVQKLGCLSRQLPRLCESSPTRILVNGFTSIAEFDKVASETLESLHDCFDELMDQYNIVHDNELTDGVLTVTLGHRVDRDRLTYVINRQTMNSQLWLSSPKSGPKRYDYFEKEDAWIYRRTKQSLHSLLQIEISDLLETNVNFLKCCHSGKAKS